VSSKPYTELVGLPPIRQVISDHALSARKSLGQHFLMDRSIIQKIVHSAGIVEGVTVLEIGPGPGGLTRALLGTSASQVVAVERDQRSVSALGDLVDAAGPRLCLVPGDALNIDLGSLCIHPFQIVANLPYNIGTKLLLNFLQMEKVPQKMTLMLQREVAERIVARPGESQYSRLSIIVQWLSDVQILFDVSSRAFKPEPKVTSSVIEVVPRGKPLAPAKQDFLQLVTKAAFGQRRKMMRTSLRVLHPNIVCLLKMAGVSPTSRPEKVSVQEFCSIARVLDSWSQRDAVG
jgi:16S rRNA (adenine1518-N6/adenine1519-N6)-dimethyltransferase